MTITTQARKILQLNSTAEKKAQLLCELLREIPYSVLSSFDPKEMVKKNTGSCTPKHIFLAQCLQKIGIQTKFLIIPFHYKKSKIKFPASKKKLINSLPLAYHTALKAKIRSNYVLIDITWDSKLKGFPTNKQWNGVSDMILAVVPEKVIETTRDPREFTKELKEKYSKKEKEVIEEFILFFNKFCEEARN